MSWRDSSHLQPAPSPSPFLCVPAAANPRTPTTPRTPCTLRTPRALSLLEDTSTSAVWEVGEDEEAHFMVRLSVG